VTLAHSLAILQQVCAGMVALTNAGLVHRDLASRNVLVFRFDASDPTKVLVKISDFGLAVKRHYQTHATVQGESVPFRWMAPEALRRRRFSEKTDVWAFGVTAWELLTGGDVPYAFLDSNEAVAERVCSGHRLARPAGCPDGLWDLLQRTWAEKPADRPTFTELANDLARLDLDPLFDTLEAVNKDMEVACIHSIAPLVERIIKCMPEEVNDAARLLNDALASAGQRARTAACVRVAASL